VRGEAIIEVSAVSKEPVIVREANADDFSAIQTLFRDGDRYHQSLGVFGVRDGECDYLLASYEAALAMMSAVLLVADIGATTVGFIRAEQVTTATGRFHVGRKSAVVHEIVVSEAVRGHGVGTVLMEAVQNWADRFGCPTVELNVFAENAAARAFYRHLGFVEQGVRLRLDLKNSGVRR
jgi:GNAT superfamily N-acetyltransferase